MVWNIETRAIVFAALVVCSMVAGATAFGVSATPIEEPEGTIIVTDQQVDQQTEHTWRVPAPDDMEVDQVVLDYESSGADPSGISADDVGSIRFGNETTSVTDTRWNGTALTLALDGTVSVEALDEISVSLGGEGVTNPSTAGEYTETVVLIEPDQSTNSVDAVTEFVEQTVAVEGTVSDRDTAVGVGNATLTVQDRSVERTVSTTTTESDGGYTVFLPTDRTYGVSVSAADYVDNSTNVTVGSSPVDGADLALDPKPVVLSGTVVDAESGDPIENATVDVLDDDFLGTETDADGEFSLEVTPGNYTVAFDADGYAAEESTVELDTGTDRTLDAELFQSGSGTVQGTVVDADTGDPIEDARVTAESDSGDIIGNASTASDGTYQFDVEAGDLEVGANADGYEFTNRSLTFDPGETRTADFGLLPENGTITGTVVDADGTAVRGATVQALDGETVVGEATTDGQGQYSLDVPRETSSLTATAPGFAETTENVSVAPGETVQQNVTLQAAAVEVTGLDLDPMPVTYGNTTTATVVVENTGDSLDEQVVTVTVDGDTVANRTVELGAGATEELTVEVDTEALGLKRGSFEVAAGTDDDTRTVVGAVTPTVDSYTNAADRVETGGLRTAVQDWQSGTIGTALLGDLIDGWQRGEAIGTDERDA